jgi:quinol monooxygenase YgiN
VAAGVLLSGIVAHVPVLRRLVTPKACTPGQEKRVFVLLVSMKLNPAMGGLQTFKEAWSRLAADVKKREPNCLSYELCAGEEDENSIIIYERYVSKADLTLTHNEGIAFKAFGKRLGEGELKGLVLEKSKEFYVETNVGFMSR